MECVSTKTSLKHKILYEGFVYQKEAVEKLLNNYRGEYLILYDIFINNREIVEKYIKRYRIN